MPAHAEAPAHASGNAGTDGGQADALSGVVGIVLSGWQRGVPLGPGIDPAADTTRVPAIEAAHHGATATAFGRRDLRTVQR